MTDHVSRRHAAASRVSVIRVIADVADELDVTPGSRHVILTGNGGWSAAPTVLFRAGGVCLLSSPAKRGEVDTDHAPSGSLFDRRKCPTSRPALTRKPAADRKGVLFPYPDLHPLLARSRALVRPASKGTREDSASRPLTPEAVAQSAASVRVGEDDSGHGLELHRM